MDAPREEGLTGESAGADEPGKPPTYTRPHLYAKQRQAIFEPRDINDDLARFSLIEASTKAGKTVGCLIWLAELAILAGKPGRNYWWVAPIYAQATIAFRRLKRALPPFMFTAREDNNTITLPNGAVIWFKGADKTDSLYGDDVFAAVLDEASRMKEEAWYAIRTTITATRGPLRIIGNVKGRKNWFFNLARRAQSGEARYAYYKITAYDAVAAGVLHAEEIEAAKRDLPENVFRELYLAEPSEDGGNPFGLSHIEACVGPLSQEPTVAVGIDLAKSVDWTVLVGLDQWCRVTDIQRWQKPWAETERRIVSLIGNTPTLIDSTGVGDPVVAAIQSQCMAGNVEGFKFSLSSKQQLMEGLTVAIQSHSICYPGQHHALVPELQTFEYEYRPTGVRYTAPAGYHDDTVCALALALRKWQHVMPSYNIGQPGGETRISPWLDGPVV